MIFSGTLVVQGKGYAEITSTGINTEFGKIGSSLLAIEQEETRMQKEMKSLIKNLFIVGAILSASVVVAFYLIRGNFIQSLLNGLAAAMAILPEEFPVVLTIFLALGAWRLSKKKVLTRKPSAIETLGSATVLCSDKTGTITQNKMDISAVYDGNQSFFKHSFSEQQTKIREIIQLAHLASQENSLDPMEKAFTVAHSQLENGLVSDFQLLKEFPISKSLLAMTRVVKDNASDQILVATKGAPEAIFSLCKLSEEETEKHLKIAKDFALKGLRIIAVATTSVNETEIPENQTHFNLQFKGLLGLEDPIRPEVPQAIKDCHTAGIKVIMITGDFPTTAKSIASQIGLPDDGVIMTGEELKNLTDEELKNKIESVTVFARVVPEQKLRIVNALKANQEVVAMTGDGVNDAPALKAANIGIAMGIMGTDVAREASSLVLLDDNFASIVSAIRLGRKIFDNLQKAMAYIIAIHIPIIGLTLLPAFFPSLPLLLMPLHIVLLELIIDPVCSIAFEYEQEEKNIMNRAPRNPNEQFFGAKRIVSSLLQGLLLLAMTIAVYFASLQEGHTDGEVRAIAFSSLIVGNVFLILTNLSKTRNFFTIITEKNWALWMILSIATISLYLILTIPFLQGVFNFEFPGYQHFIPALIGAISILIILESAKYISIKQIFKTR